MTKVVAKSSDRVVLRDRVKFSEVDGGVMALTGFASAMISTFAVAMPLNVAAHIDMGLSFLAAGGTAVGVFGATFLACYAKEVASDASAHTILKFPYRKALLGSILPFGQKIKSGKGQVRVSSAELKTLVYHPSGSSTVATHDLKSSVKFTPLGAYIEQEFICSPTKVWDDAFSSTVSVHKFRDPNSKTAIQQ